MTLTPDQIKTAALQLAPAEREALAGRTAAQHQRHGRQSVDAAWLVEARRRDAEFLAGKTGAKPVGQVIDHLLRRARP